jgi:hypothetical protein
MNLAACQKWLIVAARHEQNPYVQAELLYQALKPQKKAKR